MSDTEASPALAAPARWLGREVLVVLGLSLGSSAVYALLAIVDRLTKQIPLSDQSSSLNNSVTPDRPWLDLAYQLVAIGFGIVPVLLALYLLGRVEPPAPYAATRFLGFDLRRPWADLGQGVLLWDPLESTCRHASLSIL